MNILVTGGAGYIGSHTCKALAAAGFNPVVYDNISRGYERAIKWGKWVKGDLSDHAHLVRSLIDYKIEAVVHFAAYIVVGESSSDPAAYYQNNVLGTLSLLSAMKQAHVKKIVFSSTAAVYGTPKSVPLTEDHPLEPINPYGWSKFMSEKMILDFQRSYGFQGMILRYFNASGADPELEVGEDHVPETHLIPLVVRAALGGKPLQIFGNDYPTNDGSCIRDYIHVSDLAQAHVLALQKINTSNQSGIYNLGNGSGYSVFEVIKVVEAVSGKKVPTTIVPRRVGDPATLIANSSLAKAELGWCPKYAELETIVKGTYEWELGREFRSGL